MQPMTRHPSQWEDAQREARHFRAFLRALTYPGRVVELSECEAEIAELSAATTALARCLFDEETPVWLDPLLDSQAVRAYFGRHCIAPLVHDPRLARFALMADGAVLARLNSFHTGDPTDPDRSTTLVVERSDLNGGDTAWLAGPGIADTIPFAPAGLTAEFWAEWSRNGARYPRGVDILFVCGRQIVGLPRTSRRV